MTVGLLITVRLSAAATLHVPGDFSTIQAAVDAAMAGDSVLVADGEWGDMETRTIVLNGVAQPVRACIFGKPGVSIIGAGASSTIVQGESGVPQGHVVVLPDGSLGETFRVVGLGLRGAGEFYRGLYAGVPSWDVEILDCTIEDCAIGVRLWSGDLQMRDTVVKNLSVSQYAEMIQSPNAASWLIEDCVFLDNVFLGGSGGVLLLKESVTPSTAVVRRCRFEGTRGGQVALMRNQNLTLEDCWFENNEWDGVHSGSCLKVLDCSGFISGNTFGGNGISEYAAGIIVLSGDVMFRGNTVHGTIVGEGSLASGVVIDDGSPGFGENILSGNHGGPAFYRHSRAENPTDGCNVFWDNPDGHFENYDPQPTDVKMDPRFCDPDNLDFTLRADSPCLPGGISGCGQVGAWGEGCGTVGVIAERWARIKTLYRAED